MVGGCLLLSRMEITLIAKGTYNSPYKKSLFALCLPLLAQKGALALVNIAPIYMIISIAHLLAADIHAAAGIAVPRTNKLLTPNLLAIFLYLGPASINLATVLTSSSKLPSPLYRLLCNDSPINLALQLGCFSRSPPGT